MTRVLRTNFGLLRVVALAGLVSCTAFAAENPERPISLKALHFDARSGPPAIDPLMEIRGDAQDGAGFHLIRFDGPISDELKQRVRLAGAKLFGYFPMHTLAARMDGAARERVEALAGVAWVGVYQPSWKVAPELRRDVLGPFDRRTLSAERSRDLVLTVALWPGEGQASLDAIQDIGGSVTRHRRLRDVYEFMDVAIHPSRIRDLARLPAVSYIEEKSIVHPLNDRARMLNRTDEVASTDFMSGLDPTLDGDSGGFQVKIGHYDSGLDLTHADFDSATVTLDVGADMVDTDGHGTHTAGSMIGDGGRSSEVVATPVGSSSPIGAGQFRGIVPEAALYHVSWDQSLSDTDVLERMSQAGVHVMNNSWCRGPVFQCIFDYNIDAVVWDAAVWDADATTAGLQPMTILFGAGNWGLGQSNGCGGVSDRITTPGTAKNVITVGATMAFRGCGVNGDRDLKVATFSSRGPVDPDGSGQGMIKPDVAQMGFGVISAKASSGTSADTCSVVSPPYRYRGGTSMSTPLTTGMAAALHQDLVVNQGIAQPKPSLIKAALINGAKSMSGPCPQYSNFEADNNLIVQGWGHPDMVRTLYGPGEDPLDRQVFFENEEATNALATGETYELNMLVEPSTEPLKVTLVWTDYPATAGAGSPLVVNDLDLELTDPTGQVFYGNNFDGEWSVPVETQGVHDRYNVVENVFIESPEAGTWTVRVVGYSVSQDMEQGKAGTNQNFSIVHTGDATACTRPDAPALAMDELVSPSVSLIWSAVPGADDYTLYRSTTSCTTDLVERATTQGITDVDTPVSLGQTYYYIVRANGSVCQSHASNCESVIIGPNLDFGSARFCDGNGDGFVDAGETVTMAVSMLNKGVLEATGVSGDIATTTPGVTLLDGTAVYPDVPPFSSIEAQPQYYRFEVGPGFSCGDAIDFSFDVTSNEFSWDRTFQVRIGEVTYEDDNATAPGALAEKNDTDTDPFSPSLGIGTSASFAEFTSPNLFGYSLLDLRDYVQVGVRSPGGTNYVLKSCGEFLQPKYDITSIYNSHGGGTWRLCLSTGSATGCGGSPCPNQSGSWPDALATNASIFIEGENIQGCSPNGGTGQCGPSEVSDVSVGEPELQISPNSPDRVIVDADNAIDSYNIYVGAIGDYYTTPSKVCHIDNWTNNGGGTIRFDYEVPLNSWILVTGSDDIGESGAGDTSDGLERSELGSWDRCGIDPGE